VTARRGGRLGIGCAAWRVGLFQNLDAGERRKDGRPNAATTGGRAGTFLNGLLRGQGIDPGRVIVLRHRLEGPAKALPWCPGVRLLTGGLSRPEIW
jgi:hypothetical protein